MTKVLFEIEPKMALAYVVQLINYDKSVSLQLIHRQTLKNKNPTFEVITVPESPTKYQIAEALQAILVALSEPKKYAVRINVPDIAPFKG